MIDLRFAAEATAWLGVSQDRPAMQLDLDDDEAIELKQALDIHLVGLRGELTRTDDRAYRVGERTTLDRLEGIQRRLAQLLGGSEAPLRKAG